MRGLTGLDNRAFSPLSRDKIITASVETKSYIRAAMVLQSLAEIEISSRHINRMADKAGSELREEQQRRTALHAAKKLKVEVSNTPDLAVVETDGGRIRTRETQCGSGTRNPAWKETKTALCMRMASETHEEDPAPEPPRSLQNRHYVGKLAKEVAGAATMGDPAIDDDEVDDESCVTEPNKYESPKRLMRTVLASLDDSKTFGTMVAAEAHRKGFYKANRQAFVADGMKCNWTMWKTHFATFVPIVDFIHVISYLYKAAMAIGESEDFGWGPCSDWIRACWQGRVDEVIADLREWFDNQPTMPSDVADDDPREIVRVALGYLSNNRSRMDYPQYRRQGLPVTSTLMESLIKEISYRVKGTEKFWNDPDGANHILALKAAALSEDDRLLTAL